jgi:2-hydroxycyclohexanecarboxyl-CoA dehydrogenase
MRGLPGKIAIVTGGGGGIGRAICQRLAEAGATIGVFDRAAQAASETVDAVAQAGGRAVAVTVDITDYQAVRQAVGDFERQVGPADILVNNAGWDRLANFLDKK